MQNRDEIGQNLIGKKLEMNKNRQELKRVDKC